MVRILSNCLVYCPTSKIKDFDGSFISKLSKIIRQFNGVSVRQLDEIQSHFYNHYQQIYAKGRADKLFQEIEKIEEEGIKILYLVYLNPTNVKKIKESVQKQQDSFLIINYLLKSLIQLSFQIKSTPLIDLLAEMEFQQVIDIVIQSEKFMNENRWDKAVFEMRKAFEIIVTSLVRKTKGDSNWNNPTKDGLSILRQKGIITDDLILNQLKASNIGIYGYLSIKGVHPNGESTENLANSDLNASYCISLVSAAIEYLVQSFKKSEFFTLEK